MSNYFWLIEIILSTLQDNLTKLYGQVMLNKQRKNQLLVWNVTNLTGKEHNYSRAAPIGDFEADVQTIL